MGKNKLIFRVGDFMLFGYRDVSVATTTRISDRAFVPSAKIGTIEEEKDVYVAKCVEGFRKEVFLISKDARKQWRESGKKKDFETFCKNHYIALQWKDWQPLYCDLSSAIHFEKLSRLFVPKYLILDKAKEKLSFNTKKTIATLSLLGSKVVENKDIQNIEFTHGYEQFTFAMNRSSDNRIMR